MFAFPIATPTAVRLKNIKNGSHSNPLLLTVMSREICKKGAMA
jgi:hypothetical protein